MEILILRGLPASNKTTWAKEFIKENPGWIRVNKDDIRAMLSCKWSKKVESLVENIWFDIIKRSHHFWNRYNIIVDDTNLNPIHEQLIREFAAENDISVSVKIFDTPLHICIERDKLRENPIGEEVITKMYEKWKDSYQWLSL